MNKKISELPDATLPIASGVKFEAVQGGVNVKVDADDMPGSGAAGVTSVTGTTNRITSTGGATPVIDIDPAYDALWQPADADLAAIAALTPSNDDVLQRKAGVWTNRTLTQLGADLQTVNIGNLLYLYNNFI